MTYLQQQRSPLQSLPGLGAVILLHLGLIYALLNGLGTNIVEKFAAASGGPDYRRGCRRRLRRRHHRHPILPHRRRWSCRFPR
ncbi:MAG: hypothetical protein WDN04_05860 [Rhodospirillales bacterium]